MDFLVKNSKVFFLSLMIIVGIITLEKEVKAELPVEVWTRLDEACWVRVGEVDPINGKLFYHYWYGWKIRCLDGTAEACDPKVCLQT